MLLARKYLAYGEQEDLFEQENCIGWKRCGDGEHPGSGLAVVISNECENALRFSFGAQRAGSIWVDVTRNRGEEIVLDESGSADFPVAAGSGSVWADKQAAEAVLHGPGRV